MRTVSVNPACKRACLKGSLRSSAIRSAIWSGILRSTLEPMMNPEHEYLGGRDNCLRCFNTGLWRMPFEPHTHVASQREMSTFRHLVVEVVVIVASYPQGALTPRDFPVLSCNLVGLPRHPILRPICQVELKYGPTRIRLPPFRRRLQASVTALAHRAPIGQPSAALASSSPQSLQQHPQNHAASTATRTRPWQYPQYGQWQA